MIPAPPTPKRATPPPPRTITATPNWPPIALPGRPGWHRHHGPNGEQHDLPIF